MKIAELSSLMKEYLLPKFPGYALHRTILIKVPITYIIQGIELDTSVWDSNVIKTSSHVITTYVPTDYYGSNIFSAADRVDFKKENIAEQMENIAIILKNKLEPWLMQWNTPRDIAEKALYPGAIDVHLQRDVAYSLVLLKERKKALQALDGVKQVIEKNYRGPVFETNDWPQKILDESILLRSRLLDNNESAIELLHEWRQYTLHKLRLHQYASHELTLE
ncbi:MAG: hypothetical protein ACYDCO_15550 [Armatimonadota bacterium]